MATEQFPRSGYGGDELDRQDAEAVLGVRRELGADYDTELVNAFADRIERAIQARTTESRYAVPRSTKANPGGGRQFSLAIVSMIMAIPISSSVGHDAGALGLIVAWSGIVGLNLAHAWQTRPRRPAGSD